MFPCGTLPCHKDIVLCLSFYDGRTKLSYDKNSKSMVFVEGKNESNEKNQKEESWFFIN